MLENYIDQIITMGTLADSVTIIDDQQMWSERISVQRFWMWILRTAEC